MRRRSFAGTGRVLVVGTVAAAIALGFGGLVERLGNCILDRPRRSSDQAASSAGPGSGSPHSGVPGRCRLTWRPVDVRLWQHTLRSRHGRPVGQEPVGQGGLGRRLPGRRGLCRAARLRRNGVRRHGERLGLCDCSRERQGALAPARRDFGEHLGGRLCSDAQCGLRDIDPLGITGTPVIDAATEEIFVAEETEPARQKGWQGIRHWLVAISLRSHRVLWHRDIDPPHGNNPSYYFIPAEQQRPAITFANGRLYVGFEVLPATAASTTATSSTSRSPGPGRLGAIRSRPSARARSGRRTVQSCRHKVTCTSPPATGAPRRLQTSTRGTRWSSCPRR